MEDDPRPRPKPVVPPVAAPALVRPQRDRRPPKYFELPESVRRLSNEATAAVVAGEASQEMSQPAALTPATPATAGIELSPWAIAAGMNDDSGAPAVLTETQEQRRSSAGHFPTQDSLPAFTEMTPTGREPGWREPESAPSTQYDSLNDTPRSQVLVQKQQDEIVAAFKTTVSCHFIPFPLRTKIFLYWRKIHIRQYKSHFCIGVCEIYAGVNFIYAGTNFTQNNIYPSH